VLDAPASVAATDGAATGSSVQIEPGGGSPPDLATVLGPYLRPGVLAAVAAALGGLVLAVILASGGGRTLDLSGGQLIETVEPTASADTGGEIVVNVVGAVLRPGVYRLPAGSRVGDAIAAAGGYGPRVAADRVDRLLNLAAVVRDGDRILVPSRDDPAAEPVVTGGTGGGSDDAAVIDLNTATQAALESLPGIGPVTAAKIIAARTESPFRSIDDLLERQLVGQKTFEAIRALVTVG
jgi:competence protein ComEA